jgi:hypothetical protein
MVLDANLVQESVSASLFSPTETLKNISTSTIQEQSSRRIWSGALLRDSPTAATARFGFWRDKKTARGIQEGEEAKYSVASDLN